MPAQIAAAVPALPALDIGFPEQVLIVTSAFCFKPIQMALSFLLVIALRRQRARDLSLIRNGLLFLFLGEAFCAIDYYTASWLSEPLDFLHGAGMVAMSALLPFGLFTLLDDRVLHFSDEDAACAVNRLCKRCWKREDVTCAPHRLFFFVGPALAVLGLIPLTLPFDQSSLVYCVYGTRLSHHGNAWRQLLEFRIYPLVGAAALLATWIFLLQGRRGLAWAKRLFFAGFGFVTYSLFRFFLYRTFLPNPGWSGVWEETTELLAVAGVGALLWVFRRPLGLIRPKPAEG
ncbi:MAG: hypothetical protein PHU25_08915 [Deltaproteobacteria bacterium]|nr:hypothetical protein [Deltaproteobacteria bacterium]